jgi:hypothetical protein
MREGTALMSDELETNGESLADELVDEYDTELIHDVVHREAECAGFDKAAKLLLRVAAEKRAQAKRMAPRRGATPTPTPGRETLCPVNAVEAPADPEPPYEPPQPSGRGAAMVDKALSSPPRGTTSSS